MKAQHTQNTIQKSLIILVVMMTGLAVTSAQAQAFRNRNFNRGGSPKPIIALTAGMGTRSFLIKSDIDYINNMKATQEGWESSLLFGGDKIKVRTGFGAFKTELSDINSIKQTSINGLVNVYAPLKTKFFRPYFITGLGVNMVTFSGSFVPESPLLKLTQMCTCATQPTSDLLPPTNPGEPGAELTLQADEPITAKPESHSGILTSTQLVSGLGGEISLRKNGHYLSMFGEMRYGLPIGTTTQNASMNETKVKNNMALTFGLAFGLYDSQKARKNGIR